MAVSMTGLNMGTDVTITLSDPAGADSALDAYLDGLDDLYKGGPGPRATSQGGGKYLASYLAARHVEHLVHANSFNE